MIANYLFFFLIVVVYNNSTSNGFYSRSMNNFVSLLENKFNNYDVKKKFDSNCKGPLQETEYNALWSFANSSGIVNSACINGSKLTNSSWFFNGTNYQSPCNWNEFINCSITNNDYCTITSLVIQNCHLNGTLSPSIGNLTSLETFEITEALTNQYNLYFFENLFSKAISYFLLDNKGYEHIRSIFRNRFLSGLRGSIPSELGLLSNLKNLTFAHLPLNGTLNSWIGNLKNLEILKIEGTKLTGSLPIELYKLTTLTELHIGSNFMSGNISQIKNLVNLKSLAIYATHMTGSIPDTIQELTSLTYLELFLLPHFSCKVPDLNALQNLESLYIGGFLGPNFQNGTVHSCLHFPDIDLPYLKTFLVGFGFWFGHIPNFTLPKVEFFYFGGGFFEGTLDGLIQNFVQSNTLVGFGVIGLPCIYGEIPSNLSLLTRLESLFISELPSQETQTNLKTVLLETFSGLSSSPLGDRSRCSRTIYGSMPVETQSLKSMKYLFINNTPLNGSILDLAFNWPNMTTINLWNDGFSGTLPSAVCNLTMLRSVQIPFNRFYGLLPSCLFNQSVNQQNLRSLVLSRNLFRGHLPEKTYLPKLYDLFLESNLFSGTIPRSFLLKMKTLEYLALGSNNFSLSEAPDLRDLDNIIYIDISNCNLQGRLPELNMNKTHLKQFSANNNILSGTVPASFSNATKLLVISLYNNSLSGSLPSLLGSLTSLQVLYLDNNNFVGNVSWLSNCTKLSLLSLNNNSFTGRIPHINSMQMLSINVGNNSFTGDIPSTFANMKSLVSLSLSMNKLSGPVKNIFENMSSSLRQLQLNNNIFTSTLPDSLTNCTNLMYFDISYNSISGRLPPFNGLKKIQYFLVSHNQFSGTIPSTMLVNRNHSHGAELKVLDLSSNSFEGPLSGFLSSDLNLSNLEYLNINTNFFSGTVSIPMVNSATPKLETVVLSQNCFTGLTSVDVFCSALSLELLHMGMLHRTKSKGKVRSCDGRKQPSFGKLDSLSCLFGSDRKLKTLVLTGLELEGTIPSISNSSNLSQLLLSFNKLTGTLPAEYQSFGRFSILSINENRISGALMQSFKINPQLGGSINMSVNRLSGRVPDAIRRLDKETYSNYTVNIVQDTCGSSEINSPSLLYLVSLAFTFCLLLYLLYRKTSKLSLLLKGQVDEWWSSSIATLNPSLCTLKSSLLQENHLSSTELKQDNKLRNTKLMLDFLERTFSTCFCLCIIYFLAMITYSIVKTGSRQSEYSLFSHQYLYTVTNVYLEGISSASMIGAYLFASGFILLLIMSLIKPLSYDQVSESKQQYTQENSGSGQQHTQSCRFLSIVWIQASQLILSATGNVIYVSALIGYIALFRIINVSIIIPWFVQKLPSSQSSRQMSHVFMNLMDVIVLPLSAIIFVSPACINYFLANNNKLDIVLNFDIPLNTISCQPRSVLDDNPFYLITVSNILERNKFLDYAEQNDTSGTPETLIKSLIGVANITNFYDETCSKYSTIQNFNTQNAPPFNYSFQCSSSLISSFLAVFIYIYSFLSTFVPIVKLKVMLLSTNGYLGYIQKRVPLKIADFLGRYIFSLNEETVQDSFRATYDDVNRIADTTEGNRASEYWWNKSIRFAGANVVSQTCTHITVMLTFGLSYPLLGLMICLFIFFDVIVWRLSIGRYMKIINADSNTYDINLRILENSNIDTYKTLTRSWWIIQIIIGFYWSFFIFDVIGSKTSSITSGTIGSVILFFLYTVIFIFADKFLGSEKNLSYSIVRKLRNIAFYIHSYIWTNIFKIGSMRSIDYQEINSSELHNPVIVSPKNLSVHSDIFNPMSDHDL